MPNEEGSAVNNSVVQDTTTTAPATEEKPSLEVVSEGKDLNPNDFREAETDSEEVESTVKPAEETETEQPQSEDKPLSPKAENRFQQLANDNKALKEQIAELEARKAQFATEQELLNEVNPDTNEYYTPQEIERLAWQQSREQQAQKTEQALYEAQVQQNQYAIQTETQRGLQEFPMFDQNSPDFNPNLAALADQRIGKALITDENGQILGAHDSPYEILKTIADASLANAAKYEANAQKATEKMLANADGPASNQPVKASKSDEDKMSPDAYAKAHGLKKVWQ